MTTIQKINTIQNEKKTLITPKNTGYAAAIAIGITSFRAFTKSKPITRTHKFLGILSAVLTLIHIGSVKYLHHKYKKM